MRSSYVSCALLLLGMGSALAQETPPRVDPTIQALAQMVTQAQQRELSALSQVYELRAQVADLQKQLSEEKARSESSSSKVPKSDKTP